VDLVETLKARAVDRRLRDVKMVGEANVGPIEGFFDWQTADEIECLRAQLAAQIIIQRGWEDEARKATSQLASADEACQRLCGLHGYATGHGDTVADMIDEISAHVGSIRAQLASATERVAEMQYEAGMYHSLYDLATERLASARKALEEIETFCSADSSTLGAIARLTHIRGTARQQLLSSTDENGK